MKMELDYVSFCKKIKGSDLDFWKDPEKSNDALTEECVDYMLGDKEVSDDASYFVMYEKVSPNGDIIIVGGWSKEKIKVTLDQMVHETGSLESDLKWFQERVELVANIFSDAEKVSVFKKGTKSLMCIMIMDVDCNVDLYYGYE